MGDRCKVLLIQIEQMRNKMIMLGMEHGFTAPRTIQASQQLDFLLNQLYYLEDASSYKEEQPTLGYKKFERVMES